MTAAANLLPMAAGVLLLGERLPQRRARALVCASAHSPRPSRAPGHWPGDGRAAGSGRRSARAGALAATLAPDCGAVTAAMSMQTGGGEQQRAIRVVAADDHAAYLRATTETLTRAGLDVVGVSTSGQGAIDDVRTYAPDVALVDLRMPGLSGTDVARAVRARYPATRVVILSAYADDEIVQARARRRRDGLRHQGQHARGDRARGLPRGRRRAHAAGVRRAAVAALAGLALLGSCEARRRFRRSWTIAAAGPRGGRPMRARRSRRGRALRPRRIRPGRAPARRLPARRTGRSRGSGAAARRSPRPATSCHGSGRRLPLPFVVTSASGERALVAAMGFAQRMLALGNAATERAVIGVGPSGTAAVRLSLRARLHLGTGIAIGGRIPRGSRARPSRRCAPTASGIAPRRRAPACATRCRSGATTCSGDSPSRSRPPLPSRSSRSAEAVAPYGWVRIAAGPYGGTVWQGVIPNRADPGHPRASLVYLPPAVEPHLRYPALYLLHGLRGSPYSFVGGLRFAAVADGLIHSRRVQPFIAVMPPAGQSPQFDGEWTGPWERYVVQDVVPWCRPPPPALARAPRPYARRLLRGAYGSIDIGLRHPGLFGTLESWSGYFKSPRDGSLANATAAERLAHDPQALLPAARGRVARGAACPLLPLGRAARAEDAARRRGHSRASSRTSASTTSCT